MNLSRITTVLFITSPPLPPILKETKETLPPALRPSLRRPIAPSLPPHSLPPSFFAPLPRTCPLSPPHRCRADAHQRTDNGLQQTGNDRNEHSLFVGLLRRRRRHILKRRGRPRRGRRRHAGHRSVGALRGAIRALAAPRGGRHSGGHTVPSPTPGSGRHALREEGDRKETGRRRGHRTALGSIVVEGT